MKDAKLWASRSEGDEGQEFDRPENTLEPGTAWRPDSIDLRNDFHDMVFNMYSGPGITKGSPGLEKLIDSLHTNGFADPNEKILETNNDSWNQTNLRPTRLTMPKQDLNAAKAAQDRLHKERLLAIEGDEIPEAPVHNGAETGFDDGSTTLQAPVELTETPAAARAWIEFAPSYSFTRIGNLIAAERTLNRMQSIALGLVCTALDRQDSDADYQHLQYVGGGGGTGKSWLIDTLKDVFTVKHARNHLVITAMSGTAAAGIGGTTIHSAVGLSFKDNDGSVVDPMTAANLERNKQRWRRRHVLVIDEASMLGLLTLYEVDQKLRMLRGFPEKPFGGLPVVILMGDFLRFGPVLQRSLLSDISRTISAPGSSKPNDKTTQRRWKEAEAKKLWQGFVNVVILEEQKRAQGDPYLLGFLQRLRDGQQTQYDAAKLQAQYSPDSRFDFSSGRRAIIPLNRHRWDLALHAALAYSEETGRSISIYLSAHKWESHIPTATERTAAVLIGDEGKLTVPGIFPYVEGMPVVVNENKYMGLKVVNGAEFTATGIVHPPGLEEISVNEKLSIFLGPPSGILLESKETQGIAFPHLPPNTIILPATNIKIPIKHASTRRPGMSTKHSKSDIVRSGLPCTPGLALTDFKAQGRTLGKVLLGLYGRVPGHSAAEPERCDTISMYMQLSRVRRFEDIALIQPLNTLHFMEARMPDELIQGIQRLKGLATKTTEDFEATHNLQ